MGVADRGRDRGQPHLELVDRDGVPSLADLVELLRSCALLVIVASV